MPSHEEPIATLKSGAFRAQVFSSDLPGEFTIRFLDGSDNLLETTTMTGVSTYRQRESEILDHLRAFESGNPPPEPADLSAAGEY